MVDIDSVDIDIVVRENVAYILLRSQDRCNFNEKSEKLFMVAEMPGYSVSIFYVTIPAAAVSTTLAILRYAGHHVHIDVLAAEFLAGCCRKSLSLLCRLRNRHYVIYRRKNGIGVSVGRIVLTSLEFLKPSLDRPLQLIELKVYFC
jgi:hypothetical protein